MRHEEGAPAAKQKAPTVHTRTIHYRSTAALPSHHRWQRRPRMDVWDVIAWGLFTAIAVGTILAACATLWLVTP